MPWSQDEREGTSAESELLTIRCNHVALRGRSEIGPSGPQSFHLAPCFFTGNDVSSIVLFQIRGAAKMVAVGVGDDDVLDARWIETERLHATHDGHFSILCVVQG